MTDNYGIEFTEGKCDWTLHELRLVDGGVKQFITAANWDNARFRVAFPTIELRRLKYIPPLYWQHAATSEFDNILFYDRSFDDEQWARILTTHELAHVWDYHEGFYSISSELAAEVEADRLAECRSKGQEHPRSGCIGFTPTQKPASIYGGTNRFEDWAESVVGVAYNYTVTYEYDIWYNNPDLSSLRVNFVKSWFAKY
ncbi:MAG: hypothetical protein HC876_17610 [Chloroflexaceae bacterium]|nr:hypothetical protein [Chloroflexaceae bacterium]